MKKTFFYALPLVAAMSLCASCSSDDNTESTKPDTTQPHTFHVVMHVGASGGTRVSVDGTDELQPVFSVGDQLSITGDATGTLTLTAGANTKDGTFEGDLTGSDGSITVTLNGTSGGAFTNGVKSETLAEAVEKYSVMTGTTTIANSVPGNVRLVQQTAFVKYIISLIGTYESSKTFVEAYAGGTSFSKDQFVVNGAIVNGGVSTTALTAGKVYTITRSAVGVAPLTTSDVGSTNLYSDGTWGDNAHTEGAEKAGIIVTVNNDGYTGTAMALTNVNGVKAWGTANADDIVDIPKINTYAEAMADLDGVAHTDALIATQGTNVDYAAQACRNLSPIGTNYWYLPAIGELIRALDNLALVGGYHTAAGQESYPLLKDGTSSSFGGFILGSENDYAYGKAYYNALQTAFANADATMPSYIWSSSNYYASGHVLGVSFYNSAQDNEYGVYLSSPQPDNTRYVLPFLAF